MRSTLWCLALIAIVPGRGIAQDRSATLGAYAGFHTSDDRQPVVGAALTVPLGPRFALEPSLGGAIAGSGYVAAAVQIKRLVTAGRITWYFGAGPSWTRRHSASQFDLSATVGLQVPGLLLAPGILPFAELAVSTRGYAGLEARGGFRVHLIRQ